MLSLRFQQCFGPFFMLLVEGSSEAGLFRYLSNHVFRSPLCQKYISYEGRPFLKMFKIESRFPKKQQKIGKMFFSFWDNWIWRCCNKLCLLSREYLSLAVNVLTNSPEILHITQRDFRQLNCPHRDQQIWGRCCLSDFNSVSVCLQHYLSQRPLKCQL